MAEIFDKRYGVIDTIINQLSRFAPDADYDALPLDTDLLSYLNVSPQTFHQFIASLASHFGIVIPKAAYARLVTVNDLIIYLEAHL